MDYFLLKIQMTLTSLLPSTLTASLSETDQDLLQCWSAAFDDWLEVRHQTGHKDTRSRALNAWRDFLQFKPLLPWIVRRQDIEEWLAHHLESGLQPSTLYQKILYLASFYDFYNQTEQDESEEAFNPASGIKPDGFECYKNAMPLSKKEAISLLAAVDRENSLVGKRDYALILMHLTTAQQPGIIHRLKWSAIQVEQKKTYVHWHRGKFIRQEEISDDTWEAIRDYLVSSNRLSSITAEHYIFAPLKEPFVPPTANPKEWDAHNPLAMTSIQTILQQYVEWAELKVERLSYRDLRHTAVRLFIDARKDERVIHELLGLSRMFITRRYIEILKSKQVTPERIEAASRVWEKGPYQRGQYGFQPGNIMHFKHGYYSRRFPPDELADQAAAPKNLDEVIASLQVMLERSKDLCFKSEDPRECLEMLNIYSQAASRFANLLKTQHALAQKDGQESLLMAEITKAISEVNEDLEIERTLSSSISP